MTETSGHLLFECVHVRNIWSLFNNLVTQIRNGQECVNNYEDVFLACELSAINILKAKLIQALIQIERPLSWNREKLLDTIKELMHIERYNAIVSRTVDKFKVKWDLFENII